MLSRFYIFGLIFLVSSCGTSVEKYGYKALGNIETAAGSLAGNNQYGSEARKEAQENYLKQLGADVYITQKESWDTKLDVRKQQFNDTLKREYLELANKLAKEKNYTDSTFFRRKALKAENGDFDVFPEDPERWIVESDEEIEGLRSARLNLLDSLVGYTPAVSPLESSRAIVYYDCWVQQAQAKSLKLKQDNCKQQYQAQYAKLAGVAKNVEDKNIVEISEQYKWVDIDKSVYDKILRPELVAEQERAAKAQANELYKVEYISPKVTSLKQTQTKAASSKTASLSSGKLSGASKTTTDIKPSLAYAPAPKAITTTQTTTTTAKPVAAIIAAPPAPPIIGPLPAGVKAAEDKSLITDQSDKTPELVYMVYFEGRSDQLSDKSKAELDKTIEEIKKNNPKMVSVNGHTDRSFDSGESLIASKKRADAARDYLLSKGIAKEMIRTYGFGKTDNIIDNPEGEVRPANNRAEIVFKGSSTQ